MRSYVICFAAMGVLALAGAAIAAGGIQPEQLTCEYLSNPLGIDASQPRLGWISRAVPSDQRGQRQMAYRVLVASDAAVLGSGRGDLWDSGKVVSEQSVGVVYGGRRLKSHERCSWKVRVWDARGEVTDWSLPAAWSMGILEPAEWKAKWIGYTRPDKVEGWGQDAPSPVFRKKFAVSKPLRSAVATISGLGYYELYLNGAKVGDRVLDPIFTRYDRRILYATYDVTGRLAQGPNAVGVMLGNGFYNQHAKDVWYFEKSPWRDRPRLLVELRLEYNDGSVETVASDGSWRAATGPVVRDGIRNGEVYDARLEMPGWDTAALDDSSWAAAEMVAAPKGRLKAEAMPPNRVSETIVPVKLAEPKPGVFVFDLGQNIAGWAQLKVAGPAGTKVTLRYGERIGPDGLLERKTIDPYVKQGPFQTDAYILKGHGDEVWEPRFTYHGFRWVEVTGLPGKPTLESLRGCVVHTSFTTAGSFQCSNELANKIQQCTLWSYRSNFVGFPTDCPHREKNGWTGDAHLAAEQAMYNFSNVAAYENWLESLKDEQRESGELPGIVPTSGWGYEWGNGPAWDSAYALIPWYLYQYRGDTRVLAEHYDRLKRYVDYLTRRSKNSIVDIGLGDWVPAKTETPVAVTSTGYYYVDAVIVSNIARLLGKADDAKKYDALAEKIRAGFQKTFCKPDGSVANNSQTALSCALYQGLAVPGQWDRIAQRLVAGVEAKGGHLDTGILGAKYLFRALTDRGRVDVAWRIAVQTTPPSYGDWIGRGATTLWEDWGDGSSRNHIMFGDISAWFYQTLAGIRLDPLRPGFKHIIIRPQPVGDLKWVKAEHESIYGPIRVAWQKEAKRFSLDVTVPVNTTATVYVPATDARSVTEGGKPAAQSPGVKRLGMEAGAAVFTVGSGTYSFIVK